ncbi:hypothetical protein B0J12DRAFT_100254 [Macrophomina phaseolina]|uniref:Uncharacterized protein n=1 Tax=Macrophomina phaseolina TaxID=35725 RepID=A0ABQ8GAJ0_9PEZI|nr:hypothetical protein B0J12DRAFT_100254 [Macrophomina phaseolina]
MTRGKGVRYSKPALEARSSNHDGPPPPSMKTKIQKLFDEVAGQVRSFAERRVYYFRHQSHRSTACPSRELAACQPSCLLLVCCLPTARDSRRSTLRVALALPLLPNPGPQCAPRPALPRRSHPRLQQPQALEHGAKTDLRRTRNNHAIFVWGKTRRRCLSQNLRFGTGLAGNALALLLCVVHGQFPSAAPRPSKPWVFGRLRAKSVIAPSLTRASAAFGCISLSVSLVRRCFLFPNSPLPCMADLMETLLPGMRKGAGTRGGGGEGGKRKGVAAPRASAA